MRSSGIQILGGIFTPKADETNNERLYDLLGLDRIIRDNVMKIFLDANIYIADYHLRSPDMRLLASFLHRADAKLFVPMVVFEEVKQKYREHLTQEQKRLSNILGKIGSLAPSLNFKELQIDIKALHDTYSKRLEPRLKDLLNAKILDFPLCLITKLSIVL